MKVLIANKLRASGCVYAEEEARLLIAEAKTPAELDHMVDQRMAGLPLEHILGWAQFLNLRIAVGPGVFVPRRRSEFLARQAIAVTPPGGVVVDMGCGSGALGAAVAATVKDIQLYATDIDPTAIGYARRNLTGTRGQVFEGNLFDPLPTSLRGRVDVIIANMPYVPTAAMKLLPSEARVHEPPVALDGGADGLDHHRHVAAGAPLWLAPGGHLLVEASEQQAPESAAIFSRSGLMPRIVTSDELDTTVIIGTKRINPR
jgi:release factor glutamine methyltransferase